MVLSLLFVFALGMPQAVRADELFTYYDNANTIIDGLTEAGQAQTTITIPARVTKVLEYAFSYGSFEKLCIENGGNPEFEAGHLKMLKKT